MQFRRIIPLFIAFPALLTLVSTCLAFSEPQETVGPLTLSIASPGSAIVPGHPLSINVTVRNSGSLGLNGTVRLGVIDDWRVVEGKGKPFLLGSDATQSLSFTVIPGPGSYSALYPVHAWAEFFNGSSNMTAHAILITSVAPSTTASPSAQPVALRLPQNGRLQLAVSGIFHPSIALRGVNPLAKQDGWQGVDETTGASVALQNVDRGGIRSALAVQPAWRKGWGDVFVDYHVALPDQSPITLSFATAIRDNSATEPPSDGVEFRVLVSDGAEFKQIFTRFTSTKRWEPALVDLSAYAGREITLRLVTDPGPAHNTTCDQSYWAEPMLAAGEVRNPESAVDRLARRQKSLDLARQALHGGTSPWSWKLESAAAITGASVVPGPCGIADSFISFADDRCELVFDGFTVQVDGMAIGANRTDLPCGRVESTFASGCGTIVCHVQQGTSSFPVESRVWAEKGVLRISFAMPGVHRSPRGEPRFTSLSIGPASELARRVYAGFGNVIQDPESFDLPPSSVWLSTRHVGMDFQNSLSLVQACDVFPDRFHVDPAQHAYSLVTHHDATFSLVPSSHQAFAAARVYHDLVAFKPADGVAKLLGRICLDQWGGDYTRAAEDLEKAARYGLTDAVFVKHVWQRWGYDYRLPDIYPPAGDTAGFLAMAGACKRNGILFCPHDNYIDFYPDATGYSYDHILFNDDGTPQKAWLNKARNARSYRWSPNAFGPWLESNLKQIREAFAPTAYFLDVFSSIPPIDFYDRQGRFYPKTVTVERWGAAFDRIRTILGDHAPTISEGGHDALIGHLDAGESDHAGWIPDDRAPKEPGAHFRWRMKARDGERIPWHDMASHGSFVLFGGGLGDRYAGGLDTMHGYASDDYLSLTVLGGRNPMCAGPFSRSTVMTYWLLHDVCASLARDELLSDEFEGDNIHRQLVRFSNGGIVRVNRGEDDWTTDGVVLPSFGFIAKTGDYEADITRRGGIISGFAKSPGLLFVDARPSYMAENGGAVIPKVIGVDDLGNRRFRLRIDWLVSKPIPAGYKPFLHFVDEKISNSEEVLFQGSLKLNPLQLGTVGTYSSTAEVTVPAGITDNRRIAIRFGLYQPTGGKRLPMPGTVDTTGRARGGSIRVKDHSIQWQPELPDPKVAAQTCRLNMSGSLVDFGPVSTNGAFRLNYDGTEWKLIPLPDSSSFKVNLRLNELNATGRKAAAINAVDADGNIVDRVKFLQEGESVRFDTAAGVFAYRISLAH